MAPDHPRFVRVTHWVTAIAVAALLVSGVEVLLSHPRFYWGETGNVNTTPLFTLPVPASRSSVPTGFSFTLPDQNGWSRYLHFQSAWLLLFTGSVYLLLGFRRRHFQRDLVPPAGQRSFGSVRASIREHLRPQPPMLDGTAGYNVRQQVTYLLVVFGLTPFLVWTGLAMAPAFTAVFPGSVELLGGRQSARTLHFAATMAMTLFVVAHVTMVARAGFTSRVRAMLTRRTETGS